METHQQQQQEDPTLLDTQHPFKSSSFPADSDHPSPQLDLYTIPTHSCWFSWDSIHETERVELKEFFDNSSFTRSAKIYKEYRDFIISKYREDSSRRLTFTEVRKSLVGDVCVLRKVFNFLDKWGLINFGAPPPPPPLPEVAGDGGVRVRVEEGAPFGVRVIAAPGSLKSLVAPVLGVGGRVVGGKGGDGFKAARMLASYSDVFPEVGGVGGEKGKVEEVVVCGSCKEKCDSKYYQCTKENYILCLKCFEKGALGENKVPEDFKINDGVKSSRNQGSSWTEAETLQLLQSVLGHGDDWELVAQNVKSKTKHECISRLIELPFGELILGSREKIASKTSVDEGDAGIVQNASLSAGSNPNASISASSNQNASISTGPNRIALVSALPTQNASISAGANQNASVYAGPNKVVSSASAPGQVSSSLGAREQKFLDGASQEKEPSRGTGQEHVMSADANGQQKASSDAGSANKRSIQEMKSSSESLMENNNHQQILDNQQKQNLDNNHEENTAKESGDDIEHLEPPLKKSRIDNNSDPSRSLMEQVSLISTMVGPQITAAAANAAVTVLSDGNPLVRDIFFVDDHSSTDEQRSGNLDVEMERALNSEDSEMKDACHSSEVDKIFSVRESIPLALQTRAAVGTALGAAAAHARLLADQEEKEIENLVAFVIETQLKKLECKVRLFGDLEHLMQKEHAALEESKDSIIAQRMEILQRIVGEGLPRLRGYSSLRLMSPSV